MTRSIGIYNRYWNSFGGGEKHIGSIAEIVSALPGFDVTLIGIEPFCVQTLGARLSLDLSRCRTTIWPDDYDHQTELTRGYDVFVNSTYFSPLRSRARRAVYMCFFPQELPPAAFAPPEAWERLTRRSRWAALLPPRAGARALEPLGGFRSARAGHCRFGPNAAIRVPARLVRGRDLPLPLGPMPGFTVRRVTVDRFPCRWRMDGPTLIIRLPLAVCLSGAPGHDVFIDAAGEDGVPWSPQGDDVLSLSGVRALPSPSGRGTDTAWLHSYDAIIANSRYTAAWIERRWRRQSTILSPAVDLTTFSPGESGRPRRPRILSVGRFFAGGHNKKHDVMIETFRRMIDSGALPAGWELVLAGARHRESEAHLRYYESLEQRAAGYPIILRPDVPREELLELYRTSSLYWHAAGFGESETDHPELFEHFGITTCEAMACGLIPVVIDRAGPKEIVTDGETGYTFATAGELVEKTLCAVRELSTPRAARMQEAASASLQRFSARSFATRTRQLFEDLF